MSFVMPPDMAKALCKCVTLLKKCFKCLSPAVPQTGFSDSPDVHTKFCRYSVLAMTAVKRQIVPADQKAIIRFNHYDGSQRGILKYNGKFGVTAHHLTERYTRTIMISLPSTVVRSSCRRLSRPSLKSKTTR
jgi:hypothetical protein